MHIAEFDELTRDQLQQAVRVLQAAFANTPSVYALTAGAEAEVDGFIAGDGQGALAALEGGEVKGWIGWLEEGYSHAWELHPLAIDPPYQRRGIGTLLVRALEQRAAAAGMRTLWLGTDDEYGGTSLYGIDLYPDVLRHARTVEQTTRHPIAFYRKLGFEVVGLLPDVNGFGKPDILMSKRVACT